MCTKLNENIKPGDLVYVFPRDELTGYIIRNALYIGLETQEINGEKVSSYLVYVRQRTVSIPASTHILEKLDSPSEI